MPKERPGPERYVIAVSRAKRTRAPAGWAERLRSIEALRIVGEPVAGRAIVDATPEAIRRARAVLGPDFHIEPMIPHRPAQEEDERAPE